VCIYRHFGDSYKWLLYGDDDTFFFLDAAMQVLQHLDPDMPYFLTGAECRKCLQCRSLKNMFSTVSTSLQHAGCSLQKDAFCMYGFRRGKVLPLLAIRFLSNPKFKNEAPAGMLSAAMTSRKVLPSA